MGVLRWICSALAFLGKIVARRTEGTVGTTLRLVGRCIRNPCRFLHETRLRSAPYYNNTKNAHRYCYRRKPQKISTYESKRVYGRNSDDRDGLSATELQSEISVNSAHRDMLSTVAKLQGHEKVITGIAFPVGSDKLFSGSSDGTVRIWDCHTGQCVNVINLGTEVTSLISYGPWVFAGVQNVVKAWNIQTCSEFTINGPKGQVLAMTVGNDTLFAGAEDGVISAWRGSSEATSPFELVESLNGHTKAVVCLTIGRNKLYSGSMDHSIMVWDLDTLECKMTLNGHTDVVTSLISYGDNFLSSSHDCTIKAWVPTDEGTLKVTYTHTEENGVIALCGMTDAEDKPILFCSCRDNSVRLYDLQSDGSIICEKRGSIITDMF